MGEMLYLTLEILREVALGVILLVREEATRKVPPRMQ